MEGAPEEAVSLLRRRSEMGSIVTPALALTSHLPPSFLQPRAGCPHLLLLKYLMHVCGDPSIPHPQVTYSPQEHRGDGYKSRTCS